MLHGPQTEDNAFQIATALVEAELGDPEAWRRLGDEALIRLRGEASRLAQLVPCALARLAVQLADHPRATVRVDVVRLLALALDAGAEREPSIATLRRLTCDAARGVQRAATVALARA
jgi:hypothetical protein